MIVFPLWFQAGLGLLLALPLTTAIMAAIGIASYWCRRRGRTRPLRALTWGAIVVAPFWLAGLGFGGWIVIATVRDRIADAGHHFTLDKDTQIDGVALPTGTHVTLDDNHALNMVELPDGATVNQRGATWGGTIVFAEPGQAANGAYGRITEGTLAASAVIDAIPCRAGGRVTFYWGGQLMGCTLSAGIDVPATLTPAGRGPETYRLRCLAEDTIELDGLRAGELGGCRLAEATIVGDVPCAAGERILVSSGYVAACTLASRTQFGPIVLPAASFVTYYDAQPSNFRLPAQGGSVDAFGLSLPAGTEGSFCYHSDALERLMVGRTDYVAIEGVKLTGAIDFRCGTFSSGVLFEDTIIRGKPHTRGALISADELPSSQGG